MAQDYLVKVQLVVEEVLGGGDLSIKSFVNRDGTMDAELRLSGLPEHWRTVDGSTGMAVFLSGVFQRTGLLPNTDDGGRFWVSIGARFGPSTEADLGELAELYKRHRGLFQIASYPVATAIPSGFQNAVVALEGIVKGMISRRGLPLQVVFVRITWMPSGMSPGRFKGEKGGGN